jgi:threonine dehydrogenase-like Zn-dependent dehydrogenase
LIEVAGCGLCHTDLHYLDHGVKTFKAPPLILGHEPAGTIAEVGEDVADFTVGDRVLIPAVLSCGRCAYCRQGRESLCDHMIMLGNHIDGAYAERIALPASDLVAVPDELSLEQVCVVADAVSTPYHAVKDRGRVRGLNVVQCANLAGGHVIAVDLSDERLELARTLGAAEAINPDQVERIDKHVKNLTGGGVDVAFEAIGTPDTIRLGFDLLRRGGRLCVIGFSPDDVPLSAAKIMFYELEVVGSLGCGGSLYPEIIDLVRKGRLNLDPIVSGTLPLSEINDGFDYMRKGEGIRWVVTP